MTNIHANLSLARALAYHHNEFQFRESRERSASTMCVCVCVARATTHFDCLPSDRFIHWTICEIFTTMANGIIVCVPFELICAKVTTPLLSDRTIIFYSCLVRRLFSSPFLYRSLGCARSVSTHLVTLEIMGLVRFLQFNIRFRADTLFTHQWISFARRKRKTQIV